MKFASLFCCVLFSAIALMAQVPKKVVVEHFTNTKCSICASRNPGFYSNLSNHPDILHIAFHPSAPYSTCLLNKHNPEENDNRTKYYGQYGATPKFTIQGDNIASSQNVSSASLFTPYTGQMSEASLEVSHVKTPGTSIEVRVTVKTESSHTYGKIRLFVALVEDTVAYHAPNGENLHYDVFRKSLTNIEGDQINLPANVGDSLTFTYSQGINFDWTFPRIYALVILQEEDSKEVVQSAVSSPEGTGNPVGISEQNDFNFEVFPNPAQDVLFMRCDQKPSFIRMIDVAGKVVYQQNREVEDRIDVSNLDEGLYFLVVLFGEATEVKRVSIYR